jgi:hypothetical protein
MKGPHYFPFIFASLYLQILTRVLSFTLFSRQWNDMNELGATLLTKKKAAWERRENSYWERFIDLQKDYVDVGYLRFFPVTVSWHSRLTSGQTCFFSQLTLLMKFPNITAREVNSIEYTVVCVDSEASCYVCMFDMLCVLCRFRDPCCLSEWHEVREEVEERKLSLPLLE